MKKISKPAFKIITSAPSNLTTFDFYLVLYDELDFDGISMDGWLNKHEYEIEEELYETATYQNFYVIHATSTRGESVNFLSEEETTFSYNRTNCDSVLSYHCLTLKSEGDNLLIRTGFHESFASTEKDGNLPYNWDSMNNISNGYQSLKVNEIDFFKGYLAEIQPWQDHITKHIALQRQLSTFKMENLTSIIKILNRRNIAYHFDKEFPLFALSPAEKSLLTTYQPQNVLVVYGTLAPNQPNYYKIKHIKGEWKKATFKGKLEQKGWGADMGFPGYKMNSKEDGEVIEAWALYSEELPKYWKWLDDFEGEGYQRCLVRFELEDGNMGVGNVYALNEV